MRIIPSRAWIFMPALTAVSWGQSIITGYAGSRWLFPQDPLPALQAPLGMVQGIALDPAGALYVADGANSRIFKIDPKGSLSVFAGDGVYGYRGDGGAAVDASIYNPVDVVVDSQGNVYFSDVGNSRVRRVDPSGVIDTVAGNGEAGFSGDGGPATQASFGSLIRIAVDRSGNLYIGDHDNHRVRKVSADGIIRTIAGNGAAGSSGDGGPAASARLRAPYGLAIDSDGSLYIADVVDHLIRKVRPDGVIVTVAGSSRAGFAGDGGRALDAELSRPRAVAVDSGTLYIADTGNNRIRRVTPEGVISTVAGNGLPGLGGDGGPAQSASLNFPADVAVGKAGLLIADRDNFRVRLVTPGGVISTLAGNGNYRFDGDGGLSSSASLVSTTGVALDPSGNLNVCDTFANRVRAITPFGIIRTIAGTSRPGFSGDGGPATAASFADCLGIAADRSGALYVADRGNHRIRRITRAGVIGTFAGNGTQGFSGDRGQARAASLDSPEGVAVDSSGNVYVADTGNHRVRLITPAGVISTVVGDGAADYKGDGGPAIRASLHSPSRLAVDSSGALYISDAGNSAVRKVTAAGIISTMAGNGKDGYSGDNGPAASAMLSNPQGLAVDPDGNVYVADTGNHRVRLISTRGVITTLAGNGGAGLGGNGRSPEFATLNAATDVTLDSGGRIYIADRFNGRIRSVVPTPAPLLHLSQNGLTFRAAAGSSSILPRAVQVLNQNPGKLNFSALTSTLSGGDWLRVSITQGSATDTKPASIEVSADPAGLAPGDYFGRILVGSPGAPNSPRHITVVLNVTPPAQTPGPEVSPAGLVFTGVAGAASPAPQAISISAPGGPSLSFSASLTLEQGARWLAANPASAALSAAGSARLTIAPNSAGLTSQVYNASLKISFSDGSVRTIPVALILSPPGAASPQAKTGRSASTACDPISLAVIPTSLPSGFTAPVSYPLAVEAKVVDNCAQPLVDGNVVATFSTGDPPLTLHSLQNGTWTATWQPHNSTALTIRVNAASRQDGLKGSATISGKLDPNIQFPVVSPGGVVNSASFDKDGPVAPGMLVAILGSALTDVTATIPNPPFATELAGTQVLLGGLSIPLNYASPDQVKGMAPFDLTLGTQEIVIQHQGILSVPEPVEVGIAGPGVFTTDGSGKGTAVAYDSSNRAGISAAAPASAGEAITILCTGLGAVQATAFPPGVQAFHLEAGESAPATPKFAVSGDVSVSIGGLDADVSFAGVVPGFAGLYQVIAVVPKGVQPGDSAPVVVSVNGLAGPSVSIPIK